jgi:hypothetical protein
MVMGLKVIGKAKAKMFFSEEKNQKTFNSALAYGYGIWPERCAG